MKAYKTTAAGVIFFLSVLFTEMGNYFDNDPKTVPNFNLIVEAGIVAAGFFFAADNKP